jgi:hypothetical protein
MRNFINIHRQCLYQFGFSFLFKCFQVLKLTRQETLHSTGLEATLRFGILPDTHTPVPQARGTDLYALIIGRSPGLGFRV